MKSNIIKFALIPVIVIPLLAINSSHYQFNEGATPNGQTAGFPFDLEHAINVGADIHAKGNGHLKWQGETVDSRGGTLGAYTEVVNIFNGTNYTLHEVYDVLVKAHPELVTRGKEPYKCTDVNEHYHFSVSYGKYNVSELKELLKQGKLVQKMVNTNKWRGSKGEWLSWPGTHTGLVFYYDGTYFHMKAAGKIKQTNAIYTDQQLTEWMGGSKKEFIVYTKNGYESNESGAASGGGFNLEHAINVTANPHAKETENLPWHGGTVGGHAGMITAYVDAINILHGTNYTLLEVYNKIISAHPDQKEKNVAVYKNEDINDYYNISVNYDEYKATIDNVKKALSEGKVVADIADTDEWLDENGEWPGKTGRHTGLIFYYDGKHYHMKTSVQKNALYTEENLIKWLKDTEDELIIYSRKGYSPSQNGSGTSYIPSSNTGSYDSVVNVMKGWKNMSGKQAHREVIKYYNEYVSAHGGHKMDNDLSDRLWCSETAAAAYAKAGLGKYIGGMSSCVSNYKKHLKAAGCLKDKSATPKPGWIVCYGSGTGHTAIVVSVSGSKVKCLAGGGSGVHNTSTSKGSVRFYGAPFN